MMKVAGIVLSLAVAGCGFNSGPSPSPLGEPIRAESVEGDYRLLLELASERWAAETPLSGQASFGPVDGSASFGASGQGPLGFAYRQVDGTREMDPIWTADCATYEVTSDSPISSALKPSGGAGAGDPDEDFYLRFSRASDVRLPAGTWDISAVSWFNDVVGCNGDNRVMKATVRVEIVP